MPVATGREYGLDLRFSPWVTQQTKVQCGLAEPLTTLPPGTLPQCIPSNYHSGQFLGLYAQDECVRGNLTLNLGVRYEYVSPFTELNNRIANLDIAPGLLPAELFRARPVDVVQPGEKGTYNGSILQACPSGSQQLARGLYCLEPLRKTVVRAGYGINYNTSAYQTIVQQWHFNRRLP